MKVIVALCYFIEFTNGWNSETKGYNFNKNNTRQLNEFGKPAAVTSNNQLRNMVDSSVYEIFCEQQWIQQIYRKQQIAWYSNGDEWEFLGDFSLLGLRGMNIMKRKQLNENIFPGILYGWSDHEYASHPYITVINIVYVYDNNEGLIR